jgi:hypothetical protein
MIGDLVYLILTNLYDYYNEPVRHPPFGLSDHMSIELNGKDRSNLPKQRSVIKQRDLGPFTRLAIRQNLQQVNIPNYTQLLCSSSLK